MRLWSHRSSDPAYYIEDCGISHQHRLFHPIALCGPVCVLLSAEPSACMCVCLNLSMYEYPFRAMCQICRLITDAGALPTYCIIIAYYDRTQSERKIRLCIQMIA